MVEGFDGLKSVPVMRACQARLQKGGQRAVSHSEIALCPSFLAFEPDNVIANTNLGRMLKKKGDLVAAKGYFERALFLDPQYEQARALLKDIRFGEEI
jgi:hypothetical protein